MFWRTPIRLIGLSRHTSTYLNWLLRSAKAERSKRATSMPLEPIRKDRSALAERKMYLHTARATPCGDGWAKHLRQFGGVARALAFGLIDLRCLFLRGVNLCCLAPVSSQTRRGATTHKLLLLLCEFAYWRGCDAMVYHIGYSCSTWSSCLLFRCSICRSLKKNRF